MSRRAIVIEDPGPEQGFEGMLLGKPDDDMHVDNTPLPFDLHAAAHYAREHNMTILTEEVKKMFAYT